MERESLFARPLPLEAGVYRALGRNPRAPLAQASNFLGVTAALYEPLWRRRSLDLLTLGSYSTKRELDLMLEWLKPEPGEAILDAACSAGLYARTLLGRDSSLNVHAFDFSLPFLKKANAYAEREGVSPILVWADVRALPYRDAVFDAIVCGGSLNEFTDLGGSLREFARVLKPGGRLWLMYVQRSAAFGGRVVQGWARAFGIRFPTPDRLNALAETTGFVPLKTQHRGVVVLVLFSALGKASRVI